MSQLLLPVALWNSPPPHSVTATLVLLNRTLLVTGSSSGQLCIWSIDTEKPNKEGGLLPNIFCLGHSAPITSIIDCSFEETDAFISISTDGVMHVWRALDGKCMKGAHFTSFHPLVLACVPGERRIIALAGCHCDIELIDSWTLKPHSTLRGHQDWVTCLATAFTHTKEPLIISASKDGLVHFWSSHEDTPLRTVCVDDSPLPDISPLACVIGQDLRTFVLVTPREWILYTAHNSYFVCAVASPEGTEWLGAKYLDSDTLLAWTSQALAAAYRLHIPPGAESLSLAPSKASILATPLDGPARNKHAAVHPSSAFLPIVSPSHYEGSSYTTIPQVLYTINEFPPEPSSSSSSPSSPSSPSAPSSPSSPEPPSFIRSSSFSTRSRSLSFSQEHPVQSEAVVDLRSSASSVSYFDTNTHQYESSYSQFAACSGNFFAVGDITGHVGLWSVRRDGCLYWCSGRVSDGWKTSSAPSKAAVATATLVLEDSLILIRGHENGQISTCALPTDSFPKYYKAHAARVNCLLCTPIIPTKTSIASLPRRLLVSGSDDFTIKVWELPTFELLQTFSNHTGPITWLFPPPPHRQHNKPPEMWDNTFFSVSEDKCVGLYSLDSTRCLHLFGVHPALIASVKSKWEQDYLLVECVDGGVAMWEMGTGELEGIVYGQVAREISEHSDTFHLNFDCCYIWTSHNHPSGVCSANTSHAIIEPGSGISDVRFANGGEGGSIGVRVAIIPTLLHRTPIQIIYLDIKKIIVELYAALSQPYPSLHASLGQVSPFPSSGSQVYKKPVAPSSNSSSANANVPNRHSMQLGTTAGAPNVLSLAAYQVFSYLIPWGVDKQIDALCKREMMLKPPHPDFAFGMQDKRKYRRGGTGKALIVELSILVPAASASEVRRWKISPEFTVTVTLAAVSLAKALLNLGDGKNACVQILSYYCGLLPETLGANLNDLPLLLLATYWLDPLEDVMSAARSILFSTIDRLSAESRRDLTQTIAVRLKQTTDYQVRGLVAVVLGIIGAERPEALDEFASRATAIELLKILYKEGPGVFTQGAVDLLGKGFSSWRPYVKETTRLIRALFTLSLQGDSLGTTAHNSLLLIGAQDPKQFIVCIGAEIHRDVAHHSIQNNAVAAAAVMVLGAMVKKDPCSQLGQLPRLVETVVKSLDPHTPALRDACLKATTAVLHVMVTKYPMVSFHHDSQRLAIGSPDNVIVIYDLKTATRWHVLEGHKNSVTAVAFNENGKALSSYSIADSSVRIWQTGTSFFGILGSQPQCVKQFHIPKSSKIVTPQMLLQTVRLQWMSPSMLSLVRGWEQHASTFEVDPM